MVIVNILLVVVSFLAMEGAAWLTHKYIMHGFLWNWHRSHHRPNHGIFERNDLFSLLFAVPAVSTIIIGLEFPSLQWLFWIGLGVSLYGITYFIFHDIIVHQRIKLYVRPKNPYLRKIIRAHKVHHKNTERDNGEAFGFLYTAKNYLRNQSKI